MLSYLRFEVFTVLTMKNAVFWDVTPCGSCDTASHPRRGLSSISTVFKLWFACHICFIKHRFLQEPRGVTSQKMAFFMLSYCLAWTSSGIVVNYVE
jgi:hypothetical protein